MKHPSDKRVTQHEYVEFELDEPTSREFESMAAALRCTPFEVCVQLLREQLQSADGPFFTWPIGPAPKARAWCCKAAKPHALRSALRPGAGRHRWA